MTTSALGFSTIGHEALDDPATDPALVTRMLTDIARSNRWLGGVHAMHIGLARLIDDADRGSTLSLLDVGTGAGDLPRDAVRWARRRGVTLRPFGVERIPAAAVLAQAAALPTALACASALPFATGSVDIVLLSQMVHHLDRASAARLFADAGRIARRGVLVADLRRAPLAGLGFRVAGFLLGMHQVTIDDGVTSLARAFAPDELRDICHEAGRWDVHLQSCAVARVVAWWRTDR